eukprot:m.10370 g.10370  ORF g.10370 m.10370 type:complete len:250 (-) comp2740_c0_seq1:116-865(-)
MMGVTARRAVWPAMAAHLLGVVVFAIVLHNEHEKGTAVCCKWETPGLHPVLMVFAFAWLGPWASLSYTTLEWISGASHARAKSIHGALHTATLICAWLGFATKYQGSNSGGVEHFRSVHSMIGMLVLVAYTAQWLVGALVFIPDGVNPMIKRMVHPWHGVSGLTLLVLSLGSIVTGALTYAGKSSDANLNRANFRAYATVSFLVLPLGMALVYVTSARTWRAKQSEVVNGADGQERARLLAGGSKGGWP